MRNKTDGYFKNDDLTSIENLNQALIELAYSRSINDMEEHNRRNDIATELIKKLKSDDKKTPIDKVAFLNAAIVHFVFSSRNYGGIKRTINSLLSGKEVTKNLHPYFQSTSQSFLIAARDEIEESYRLDQIANTKISSTHN